MRLKHATLLAKLPYTVDTKTRGAAWMKCKGSAFLQIVWLLMRHFWENYLHKVLPNQIETYLVKTWSTPSTPPNGVICNNTNVSHSTVGIVVSGYHSIRAGFKPIWPISSLSNFIVRMVIAFSNVKPSFFTNTSLRQRGLKFWSCFLFHL